MQPTSPLRNNFDIDRSIELLIKKDKDFLVSVNKSSNKYNGAIYINKINNFLKTKNFQKKKILFEMSSKKSIDIDNLKDFKKAEKILRIIARLDIKKLKSYQ